MGNLTNKEKRDVLSKKEEQSCEVRMEIIDTTIRVPYRNRISLQSKQEFKKLGSRNTINELKLYRNLGIKAGFS